MLLRLVYRGMTNAFALLRLLPMTDRADDAEILTLRHHVMVLERHLGTQKVRFDPSDRAFLAALLHTGSRPTYSAGCGCWCAPDTILRWHRDLVARRHASVSRSQRPGRPRTIRSIRGLVPRLVAENPSWGYRRIHGKLLILGAQVAASTVWEILQDAGIDPAPPHQLAGLSPIAG